MPRTCTICSHPERAAIDRALVSGEPFRNIAEQTGTSPASLMRHKTDHLPASLVAAKEASEVAQADKLLSELQSLKGKAVALLLKAEQAGDFRTALAGIREARGCIETLLEVEGELDRRPQVNVLVAHPEWLAMRSAILAALQAHPAARRDVVAALGEADTYAVG